LGRRFAQAGFLLIGPFACCPPWPAIQPRPREQLFCIRQIGSHNTMPKKRTSPNRNVQIADQIQRDLSELLREVKDPRIGIVTIQSVELTPDYAHAKVFFTTLTGDPQQTLEALIHAAGHLHNQLFKRLHIHTVPTLHFHYDKTIERAVEMSRLIDEANANRAKED
jgi:ribosome-binding factor A